MTTPEQELEAAIQERAPLSARLRDKMQAEGGLPMRQFGEEVLGVLMALEIRLSYLKESTDIDFEDLQELRSERGGS